MLSSIASLKENLNKIVLDVHDNEDDEDLSVYRSSNGGDFSGSDRRNSSGIRYSRSVSKSPIANGYGAESPVNHEIEMYKAEIRQLQEAGSEIKALLINYAALLKEKEDQISRLNQENGSLKQNLAASNNALIEARTDLSRASNNNAIQGNNDHLPNKLHRSVSHSKNRNQTYNGIASKFDGLGNDSVSHVKEKELADSLEERNRTLAAVQATLELQRNELEKEQENLAKLQLALQEERRRNETFEEELESLRLDKEQTSLEMNKLRGELNAKLAESKHPQMQLNGRENQAVGIAMENLKEVNRALEKENTELKLKKSELETALEATLRSTSNKVFPDAQEALVRHPSNLNKEKPESFPGKEEMEQSLQRLENSLEETRHERDKARQELKRLKQHLLEKESEESEKMDEDSRLIEELRKANEYQRSQILQLEKALKQAIASQENIKMSNDTEIQKSKEVIDDLNQKLTNCLRTIEAKNVELLNLETALGQYYAEVEAKEHFERELAVAREESMKLSARLKDADEQLESSKKEKEEVESKLLQAEKVASEWKNRVNKLEEDNAKVRRVLEQSMTRLNRMSVDSDYLVDRRIVIKLLVTYFQRNHSKEVLDLMVRMLGFSEEDKQRIGMAQQGTGKGVVRGVLGLPGRLVGGILGGGGSADAHSNTASDNQSFADLWVDFLLKEVEERERRDAEDAANKVKQGSPPHQTSLPDAGGGFARTNYLPPYEHHSDSEYSTVPLTSSDSNPRLSRLQQQQHHQW
ncbi:PREDICTED: golgin candidate 4 [Tarenaya hassleriana]|uniref:golgin candidate 4 n=1 Tax=Tarenaya hassleriana TaxID=28532 RepID=UPI00053C74F4|nr:PREDICTED: golgin candidate 4 [Tarenaya hassleriana]